MTQFYRILVSPFLVLALIYTFQCRKSSGPQLTNDFLSGSEWRTEFQFGITLKFQSDGSYILTEEAEGCGGNTGTFSISGDRVHLNINKNEFCLPNENQFEVECIYTSTDESLDFLYQLDCKEYGSVFKRQADRVSEGLKRKVDNKEVVSMGMRKGRVTTALKFRTEPVKTAEAIQCNSIAMGMEIKTSLSKDTELIILARTAAKDKVDGKWENYWYYVYPLLDYETFCQDSNSQHRTKGWVFGEFVNIE